MFFFRHDLFQLGVSRYFGWKFGYEKICVNGKGISFAKVRFAKEDAECLIENLDLFISHRKGFWFDVSAKVHAPLISVKREGKGDFSLHDLMRIKLDIDEGEVRFLGGAEREHVYFSWVSQEKTLYLSDGVKNDFFARFS